MAVWLVAAIFLLSVCRRRRQAEGQRTAGTAVGARGLPARAPAHSPTATDASRRVDRNRRRVHVHVHAHDVVSLCLRSATVKLPLLCFPLLGCGCCSVCAVGWTPLLPLAVARRCRAPRLPPPPPTSPSLHIRARARRAPATTSCRTAPPRPPQLLPAAHLLAFLVGGIEAGFRRRPARSRSSAAAPEVRGIGSIPSDSASSAASGSRLSFCFA